MAMKDLNTMDNLAPRVKKSTGSRRITVSKNDEVSTMLEAAGTPEEVGKLLKSHGVTEEEIFQRAQSAPNFGQFRMVAGNRLRGIVNRLSAASQSGETLSKTDAAYPKKNRRAAKAKVSASDDAKSARKSTASKATKKTAKKAPAKRERAAKTAKAGKKVGKKASAKSAPSGEQREAFSARCFHQDEAREHARSFGSKLVKDREFGSREAAVAFDAQNRNDDLIIVHNGTPEVEGDRWILCRMELVKDKPMEG